MNFLHNKWPELVKSGFVKIQQTPIVRSTRGAEVRDWASMSAFRAWEATAASRGFRHKYFKGLGTWTSAEAKKLLGASRPVTVSHDAKADESIVMAFDGKKADARKQWILDNVAAPPEPDYSGPSISVSDFVNSDLVSYSVYSVQRALPALADGLKTGQRKVLFTVFERGYLTKAREVKVVQLAGAVSERTQYLHGEKSLCDTIVNMAQAFPGANNLALLSPEGQFGSRLGGGKDSSVGGDAASERYIYTYATPAARALFRAGDEPLLERLREDGHEVEPRVFWPVLPLLLLNGSSSIATGYSTDVPPFKPADVAANVRRVLAGEEQRPMSPWFGADFAGVVAPAGEGKWTVAGAVAGAGADWTVTELPPGTSFNKFAAAMADDKSPAELLENRCTDVKAHFKLRLKEPAADAAAALKALKLVDRVSATNMHVFDLRGGIKKYATAEAMIADWVPWRLELYARWRAAELKNLEDRAAELDSRARFVRAVIAGDISLTRSGKRADLVAVLRLAHYVAPEKLVKLPSDSYCDDAADEAEAEARAARLAAQLLEAKTPRQIWAEDLDKLQPLIS